MGHVFEKKETWKLCIRPPSLNFFLVFFFFLLLTARGLLVRMGVNTKGRMCERASSGCIDEEGYVPDVSVIT